MNHAVTVIATLFLLTVFLSLPAIAQVPEIPNRLNSSGERVGRWLLWVDESLDTILEDSSTAEYYVQVEFVNGKPNGVATYHYKSGELRWKGEIIELSPFTPIDGEQTFFHKNGTKAFKVFYKSGKMEGVAVGYYKRGAKQFEIPYRDDKREGVGINYYESGAKEYETPYEDDKIEGLMIGYYEKGAKKYEIPMRDGKAEGLKVH